MTAFTWGFSEGLVQTGSTPQKRRLLSSNLIQSTAPIPPVYQFNLPLSPYTNSMALQTTALASGRNNHLPLGCSARMLQVALAGAPKTCMTCPSDA